jgi:thiol-disulfide isomerase/thioredoxin
MKKTGALLTIVLLIMASWAVAGWAEEKAEEAPKILGVGDKLAEFSLADGVTGDTVSLAKDFVGKSKVLAVSFMNTSCSACNAEIRLLSQMAGKYPDLKVIAMAVDARGAAVVKSYNENNKYKVSYVLDPEYTQPPRYGFSYTPALILADKDGKIFYMKGGFNPIKESDALIKEIESKLK